MKSLSQTLLDAARDEVAKEYGFNEWSMMMYSLGEDDIQHLSRMSKRAALLAMEKQAEFYEWASNNWWSYKGNSTWYKLHHSGKSTEQTTEELYEIWEGK